MSQTRNGLAVSEIDDGSRSYYLLVGLEIDPTFGESKFQQDRSGASSRVNIVILTIQQSTNAFSPGIGNGQVTRNGILEGFDQMKQKKFSSYTSETSCSGPNFKSNETTN